MNNFDPIESGIGLSADALEPLTNCEGWVRGCGREFEKLEMTVSFENEVGKRAARVNADTYDVLRYARQD